MRVFNSYIITFIGLLLLPTWEIASQIAALKFLNVQYSSSEADDNERLSLDIYSFSNNQNLKPVVIYFHGGAWSMGDKTRKLENKISLFHNLDYVFVSANYRLSPFPARPSNPERIKFPIHNRDVAKAIKWIHDSISGYGGDPEKLVLMGHSAGAHLVSLTGTNARFLNEVGLELSHIKGIISLDSACYDVGEMVNGRFRRLYINAFGTDSEENREASPIYHISEEKDHPDFLVVNRGSEDRKRKITEFVKALEDSKVNVREINADIYTHAGVNNTVGDDEDDLITPVIMEFLKERFDE